MSAAFSATGAGMRLGGETERPPDGGPVVLPAIPPVEPFAFVEVRDTSVTSSDGEIGSSPLHTRRVASPTADVQSQPEGDELVMRTSTPTLLPSRQQEKVWRSASNAMMGNNCSMLFAKISSSGTPATTAAFARSPAISDARSPLHVVWTGSSADVDRPDSTSAAAFAAHRRGDGEFSSLPSSDQVVLPDPSVWRLRGIVEDSSSMYLPWYVLTVACFVACVVARASMLALAGVVARGCHESGKNQPRKPSCPIRSPFAWRFFWPIHVKYKPSQQ